MTEIWEGVSARRRVDRNRACDARVCRKYPEAFERVAKGELQLSVLCVLAQYLTPMNAAELFAASSRKSYEQEEMLLAVRFPKADPRDLIRRLPVRTAESAPDIGTNRAAASEASVGAAPCPPRIPDVQQAAPIQPAPRATAQTAPAPTPARGAVKPLSEHRFSFNFTADSEFRELLEEVRALASHAPASGSLMSLMKLGLQALRGELLKKRFGVGREQRRVRASRRCSICGCVAERTICTRRDSISVTNT